MIVLCPDIPAVQIQGSAHQVTIGHLLTLICDISANPTQTSVQWLKSVNGSYQTISFPNNKYGGSTVTTPHLTILNTDLNDEGYYICTASNSIGTGKSLEAYLDVILGKLFFINSLYIVTSSSFKKFKVFLIIYL